MWIYIDEENRQFSFRFYEMEEENNIRKRFICCKQKHKRE